MLASLAVRCPASSSMNARCARRRGSLSRLAANRRTFDDAVIEGAILGIFAAAGQTRIVGSRLLVQLVQRSAHNEFIDKRVAFPLTAKTGDPTTYDTQVGPVTTPSQYKKILDYIAAGRAEGAQVSLGGSRRQGAVWRRLVYRADDLHGRKQQDAARTEGDFRPGAVSRSVGQRRRHRQRHTLWPGDGHGDAGHPAIDHHVGAPARRHCLGSTPVARSVSCHPLGANSAVVSAARMRRTASTYLRQKSVWVSAATKCRTRSSCDDHSQSIVTLVSPTSAHGASRPPSPVVAKVALGDSARSTQADVTTFRAPFGLLQGVGDRS